MFTFMYLREKFGIPAHIRLSWGLIETKDGLRLVLKLQDSKVYLDIAERRFYGCKNVKIYQAWRTPLDKDTYLFSTINKDGHMLDKILPKTYLNDVMYATRYSADLEKNPPL